MQNILGYDWLKSNREHGVFVWILNFNVFLLKCHLFTRLYILRVKFHTWNVCCNYMNPPPIKVAMSFHYIVLNPSLPFKPLAFLPRVISLLRSELKNSFLGGFFSFLCLVSLYLTRVKSFGICLLISDVFYLSWPPLLSRMLSHMAIFYLFFMANCYLIVSIYHILMHSTVVGCLGCFYILTIIDRTIMNMSAHTFLDQCFCVFQTET